MPQHITVREYDPAWKEMYCKEKCRIIGILGSECISVYHIGSTSVPGLAAKPIIDIMVSVRTLSGVDSCRESFEAIGYEWLGEFGIPGRRYLRKGGDERTHQMHIFQCDDRYNIERHLAFRSYLGKHADAREAYAALKKNLAAEFPYDIEGYCSGKHAAVKEMEKKALSEYDPVWDRLFTAARKVQGDRQVSPFMEAGAVGAALITDEGNIHCGVSIDTACSLGMCAERNAISSMITAGESRIERIAIAMPDGKAGMPCGACQEMMMQLSPDSGSIRILTDSECEAETRLSELAGPWWGYARMRQE